MKSRRKPQSNISNQSYTSTGLDEAQKDQNYTLEQDSSNSAKEGNNGEDGWGETCFSRSTTHPPEPNNPYIPSHHAPTPPSPNPPPSESILEPPGDLSPSPASKIATLIPSSLMFFFFFFLVVSLLCESNKTHFTHYNLVRDNGWRVGVLVWCESKMAKDVSHL